MRVTHSTKIGGVWYPAGAEVPEGTDFIVDNKVIGKVDGDVIEVTDKEVIEETLKDMEKTYTKTEINRMPLDELKALATEKGVDGADDMTGGELKKLLIEMFNLQDIGESEYEY